MPALDEWRSHYLRWNQQGIFPLPGEAEEQFCARAHLLASQSREQQAPQAERQAPQAALVVRKLFDIDPDWVPVTFCNQGLRPWEGGCLWCDEAPHIQLRKAFLRKERLFGLYAVQEVLAHEYVHAVRMPLNSRRFEEFFSYFTASRMRGGALSFLRTAFGPLFQQPAEVLLLAIVFFCSLILAPFFWYAPLIPIVLILALLGRLACSWRIFWRCRTRLAEFLGDHAHTYAVMVRLLDREIAWLARAPREAVAPWIEEQKRESLRWKIICEAYCHPPSDALFSLATR